MKPQTKDTGKVKILCWILGHDFMFSDKVILPEYYKLRKLDVCFRCGANR